MRHGRCCSPARLVQVQDPEVKFGWKDIVEPILQVGCGVGCNTHRELHASAAASAARRFVRQNCASSPVEIGPRHPFAPLCLCSNKPVAYQPTKLKIVSFQPYCAQLYTESTDGSFIEAKESALVWHYRDADPDFGSWQVGCCVACAGCWQLAGGLQQLA